MSTIEKDVAGVKTDTEAIRDDTAHIFAIRQDTAQIESLVQQIGFLRIQLEAPSMQDARNAQLRRFLDQSVSYTESIVDPFDDDTDALQDVPAQAALSEAASASSFTDPSDEEVLTEAAQLDLFSEPQRAEYHPQASSGSCTPQSVDYNYFPEAVERELQQPEVSPPPPRRSNYNRSQHRPVGSTRSETRQSSSSQSTGSTLAASGSTERGTNTSISKISRTVLRGGIRYDEQAIETTTSRRQMLTERQKNELDAHLSGVIVDLVPPMATYYYIGQEPPKKDAPERLVEALLDAGADVNAILPNTNRCCLQAEMLRRSPRSEVIRMLLIRGASLSQAIARRLLIVAIYLSSQGDEDAESLAEVALDNGVLPNMRIEQVDNEMAHSFSPGWKVVGWSVAAYAALLPGLGALQLLVTRGAILDHSDLLRMLFTSARPEQDQIRGLELAQFALDHGATPNGRLHPNDVNVNDRLPRFFKSLHVDATALTHASENKKWGIVKLMTDHGATYDARVLTVAVRVDAWRELDWLISWKCRTNATAEIGADTVISILYRYEGMGSGDIITLLQSIIAAGAIISSEAVVNIPMIIRQVIYSGTYGLTDIQLLQAWLVLCYETERHKRLRVNKQFPGTYTDAQCCPIRGYLATFLDPELVRKAQRLREAGIAQTKQFRDEFDNIRDNMPRDEPSRTTNKFSRFFGRRTTTNKPAGQFKRV